MSARSLVGIVFYVLGLIVLIFAGLNFNNLFFTQKLLTKPDIPVYSQMVFLPILLGVLGLLDGSFVANLKRASGGILYALGNLAWLWILLVVSEIVRARERNRRLSKCLLSDLRRSVGLHNRCDSK